MYERGKRVRLMYAGLTEESATILQRKKKRKEMKKITFSKTESTVSIKIKNTLCRLHEPEAFKKKRILSFQPLESSLGPLAPCRKFVVGRG